MAIHLLISLSLLQLIWDPIFHLWTTLTLTTTVLSTFNTVEESWNVSIGSMSTKPKSCISSNFIWYPFTIRFHSIFLENIELLANAASYFQQPNKKWPLYCKRMSTTAFKSLRIHLQRNEYICFIKQTNLVPLLVFPYPLRETSLDLLSHYQVINSTIGTKICVQIYSGMKCN